ncbi:MAG: hypothetical protein LBE60_10495 [Microbacterium sp.]|jgi:hypothetical protein|uniref:hypothetical protein n=1 Tax=Microbacterium sp. TaxID=51671 RepID=UPI0028306C56|nr:hypothetical protein [Microbacterium sp.]MDR2322061.1 hypothetical protein [Microbacterium sp.]
MTALRSLRIAGGRVEVDPRSGAPLAFLSDADPGIRYLLREGLDAWHTAEHRWGTGFVIGSVSARWAAPDTIEATERGSRSTTLLGSRLGVEIVRDAAEEFRERYVFTNRSAEPLTIASLGVVTPFRDVYDDAATSLAHGVHAHVWTGGRNSWVLGQPMSGRGPVLTLQLTEGRLDAYSVESRNQSTSSNVRGHLVLHPTDAGRSPAAFGGQTPIVLAPGEEFALAWSVRWHDSIDDARTAVRAGWEPASLSGPAGEGIMLPGLRATEVEAEENAIVEASAGGAVVRADRHGIVHVRVGEDRTALFFHAPVEALTRARTRFILDRQRTGYRGGADAHAFVPFDTRTGLPQLTSGWPDWSDGAERVAMPTLLQQARIRGWIGAEADRPLADWARFARARLLDDTGAPRWGSVTAVSTPRLYNSPWLAQFFADQFGLSGADTDLELAATILERSYELGATRHLSIGQPEAALHIAALLDDAGQAHRADRLRQALLETARHFAALGPDLPGHEVNYEQSMVAPLVSLYALADRLEPGAFDEPLRTSVRWLRAFAGPQPHARMRHIGIRHWDGFWFGALRRWGDVFPHHWSVLSAVALTQLPDRLRTAEMDAEAEEIFRANLVSFHPDGSATSAFVLPSAVDGDPAYSEDPLANDQDWVLTLLLRTGAAVVDPA